MGEKIRINIVSEVIEVTAEEMTDIMKDVASYYQDHRSLTTEERITYIKGVVAPYVV